MIQVRKVIEHVYEKVMGQGSDAGSQTANNSAQDRGEDSEDLAAIAEEKVELVCNDQVRLFTMDDKQKIQHTQRFLICTSLNSVCCRYGVIMFNARLQYSKIQILSVHEVRVNWKDT